MSPPSHAETLATFRERVERLLADNQGEVIDLTTRRYLARCRRCGAAWVMNRGRPLQRAPACDGRCRRRPYGSHCYLWGSGRRFTWMTRYPHGFGQEIA